MGNIFSNNTDTILITSPTSSPTTTSSPDNSIENETVVPAKLKLNKYGWKRDKHDYRDQYHYFYRFTFLSKPEVDLRKLCPPVYNQGHLGSCTANAISAAYEFDQIKEKESKNNIFVPSRLFIYYNERAMEDSIEKDNGAEIRDGIKSINKIGVCPEQMWPYDVKVFQDKPDNTCYKVAKHHRGVKYRRLMQDLDHFRQCLVDGYPFMFGFRVYESFESDEIKETGIMEMPKQGEMVIGGHAVLAVGFSDISQHFIVRNSWGSKWGDNGYFYMPYDFIKNPHWASDFWTLTRVQDIN